MYMKEIISIVLGNDHKNPLGVIQSLGQVGIKSIAICWGKKTGLLKSSKYTRAVYFADNAEHCIDIILSKKFETKYKTIVITPCSDEAAIVLDRYRKILPKAFRFQYSDDYSIEELCDKELQARLARMSGLDVPETYKIFQISDIPSNPPYPCIVKPLISMKGSKNDLRICSNYEELMKNLIEILPHNQGILLQRYIVKDCEYLVECCGLEDGNCVSPVIIKNEMDRLYPKEVGLSSLHEVYPFEDEQLKSKISKLMKLMAYTGLVSVEFAKSAIDGKWYFFEFNVRNDGYNPCCTKSGVNINYLHFCDLAKLPYKLCKANHKTIISEVRHLQTLKNRYISIYEWYRDIRNADGFTWYYCNDRKPFIFMIIHLFIEKIQCAFR